MVLKNKNYNKNKNLDIFRGNLIVGANRDLTTFRG